MITRAEIERATDQRVALLVEQLDRANDRIAVLEANLAELSGMALRYMRVLKSAQRHFCVADSAADTREHSMARHVAWYVLRMLPNQFDILQIAAIAGVSNTAVHFGTKKVQRMIEGGDSSLENLVTELVEAEERCRTT